MSSVASKLLKSKLIHLFSIFNSKPRTRRSAQAILQTLFSLLMLNNHTSTYKLSCTLPMSKLLYINWIKILCLVRKKFRDCWYDFRHFKDRSLIWLQTFFTMFTLTLSASVKSFFFFFFVVLFITFSNSSHVGLATVLERAGCFFFSKWKSKNL